MFKRQPYRPGFVIEGEEGRWRESRNIGKQRLEPRGRLRIDGLVAAVAGRKHHHRQETLQQAVTVEATYFGQALRLEGAKDAA